MNDVAAVSAGPANAPAFDEAAFLARLAELNPWLREPADQHETLRRAATHARHQQGKDAWNAWGQTMLAEKAKLEAAGVWAVESDWRGVQPKNNATSAWLAAATAEFSSSGHPHTFPEEVRFSGFVFPGYAEFIEATFSGDAGFDKATFSGTAGFQRTKSLRDSPLRGSGARGADCNHLPIVTI